MNPKDLARQYGFTPQRSAGQNFLVDPKALQKIVAAADLRSTDTVLEVGPGFGVLTEELLKRAGRVVAVELDKRLVEALRERFVTKLSIIHGDALKLNDFGIAGPYKVVANIPYNITSALIRKFLEAEHPSELMVLLVQKEVAERVCAKPGDMSLLSVSVQYYAKPEIVATVKAGCFWPAPKVDSAILKITPFSSPYQGEEGRGQFFDLVRAGFAAKRKQLRGNLARHYKVSLNTAAGWLREAGLPPLVRAEELSVEEWKELAGQIALSSRL